MASQHHHKIDREDSSSASQGNKITKEWQQCRHQRRQCQPCATCTYSYLPGPYEIATQRVKLSASTLILCFFAVPGWLGEDCLGCSLTGCPNKAFNR